MRDEAAVTAKSELRLCASGYVLLRENIMHIYVGHANGLSRWESRATQGIVCKDSL